MSTQVRTDWDAYYRKPAGFAPFSRKITIAKVVRLLEKGAQAQPLRHMVEFGGGNSCVYAAIANRFGPSEYQIIDNNALGLTAFQRTFPTASNVTLTYGDVLAPRGSGFSLADAALSIGLIEHFDHAGTAQAVKAHFDAVKPGGIVLLTFPTPTFLYRAVRGAAELLSIWKFPDERPLGFLEVCEAAAPYGELLHQEINWPIFLTQGLALFRKHG